MQQEKKSLSERFITKENKKKGAENVPPKKAEDSAPVKPEAPKQKAVSKKEKPILSEAEIKKRKAKKTKVCLWVAVLSVTGTMKIRTYQNPFSRCSAPHRPKHSVRPNMSVQPHSRLQKTNTFLRQG